MIKMKNERLNPEGLLVIKHRNENDFFPLPDFWGDFSPEKSLFNLYQSASGVWTPPTDIYETREYIVIKMELAGTKKKDIEITLDNNILSIQGSRHEKSPERDKNYHLMEIHFGRFHRAFRLPPGIGRNDINATYKEGFLLVTIPKKSSQNEEISIETEG